MVQHVIAAILNYPKEFKYISCYGSTRKVHGNVWLCFNLNTYHVMVQPVSAYNYIINQKYLNTYHVMVQLIYKGVKSGEINDLNTYHVMVQLKKKHIG